MITNDAIAKVQGTEASVKKFKMMYDGTTYHFSLVGTKKYDDGWMDATYHCEAGEFTVSNGADNLNNLWALKRMMKERLFWAIGGNNIFDRIKRGETAEIRRGNKIFSVGGYKEENGEKLVKISWDGCFCPQTVRANSYAEITNVINRIYNH